MLPLVQGERVPAFDGSGTYFLPQNCVSESGFRAFLAKKWQSSESIVENGTFAPSLAATWSFGCFDTFDKIQTSVCILSNTMATAS